MNKFYVIEKKYVGPNQDQHIDDDCIIISTQPAVYNMTGNVCTAGWCGTTNDWATFALGVYDTMDDADAAVRALGPVRDTDPGTDEAYYDPYDDENGVLARYKRGLLTPMSRDESISWSYETIADQLSYASTDADIAGILTWLTEEARYQGYTIDIESVSDYMSKRRAELIEEQE